MIRYIYKIICLQGEYKNKYYIGKHKTENIDDNYTGSGTNICEYYKQYGKIEGETYIKEILAYAETDDELTKLEKQYIGDKNRTDDNCLNIKGDQRTNVNHKPSRALLDRIQKEYENLLKIDLTTLSNLRRHKIERQIKTMKKHLNF